MNPITDERHLFFLRHEAQIRDWSALEREVRDAVNAYLDGVVESLVERTDWVPGEDTIVTADTTRWSGVVLRRPTWPAADEGYDPITIRIEWDRQRVGLAVNRPSVGVRVDPGFADGTMHAKTSEQLEDLRRERNATKTRHWPLTMQVDAATPEMWESPTLYGELVARELEGLWGNAADIVDAALTNLSMPD